MSVTIEQVTTPEQMEEVYRFRYRIHVTELGKDGDGVDHENGLIRDVEDVDAVILVARDGEHIVGTLRCFFGNASTLPDRVVERFDIAPILTTLGGATVSTTSRFMVDPAYRGRTVASLLINRIYEIGLAHGSRVDFCWCETELLGLYYRLGYRPYTLTRNPAGAGLRVPLLLCLRDVAHLRRVRSPFLRLLSEDLDDEGATARICGEVYAAFDPNPLLFAGDLRSLWAELAVGHCRGEHPRPGLFDEIPQGQMDSLFRRCVCLRFEAGETIFVRDQQKLGLGVLLEGKAGFGVPVEGEHHWVEMLQPGDVFGRPERSDLSTAADLVAIERAQTVLIPTDFFDRVASQDLPLALKLTRNLVAVLNHRLNECHRQAAMWSSPGP